MKQKINGGQKNILYISSACNRSYKKIIDKNCAIPTQMSIVNFHNAIIDGLYENDCNLYSLIGLPVSYKISKKMFWEKNIIEQNNKIYNQVGFINIPILKQLSVAINIKKNVKKWIKDMQGVNNKFVVVDASFVSVLPFIYKIIIKNKIPIIGIFADIYDYMFDTVNQTKKLKIVKKITLKKMKKVYDSFCGYVFITEQMDNLINHLNKPYIVLEGLLDEEIFKDIKIKSKKTNTIMYAGGINEKYGIKELFKCFLKDTMKDYKLILCGNGDLSEYIEKNKFKSNNIKYLGAISHEEVLRLEKEVNVLINTRPIEDEYTKYSFPSKTIEYMFSGTPVLTTNLPGIPSEYKKYLFFLEKVDAETMEKSIKEILSKEKEELEQFGKNAKEFILKNKIKKAQANKILKLLKKIEENKSEFITKV